MSDRSSDRRDILKPVISRFRVRLAIASIVWKIQIFIMYNKMIIILLLRHFRSYAVRHKGRRFRGWSILSNWSILCRCSSDYDDPAEVPIGQIYCNGVRRFLPKIYIMDYHILSHKLVEIKNLCEPNKLLCRSITPQIPSLSHHPSAWTAIHLIMFLERKY